MKHSIKCRNYLSSNLNFKVSIVSENPTITIVDNLHRLIHKSKLMQSPEKNLQISVAPENRGAETSRIFNWFYVRVEKPARLLTLQVAYYLAF